MAQQTQELDWFSGDTTETGSTKEYDKLISEASKRYDVPEHWIRTVIEHESGWNPKAWRAEPKKGEGVGSRGLMQIMPGTAKDLGFKGENYDELYEPETNIDLGAKLLGQLKTKHGSDFDRVYSAYNSGDPDAYKTRADVKSHLEKANEVFNKDVEWHSADEVADKNVPAPEDTGVLAGAKRAAKNIVSPVVAAGAPPETPSEKVAAASAGGLGLLTLRTANSILQGAKDEAVKAYFSAGKGNYSEALGHGLATMIPLVGPWAANLGERAGTGDVSGATTEAALTLGVPKVLSAVRPTEMALRGSSKAGNFATDLKEGVYTPSKETVKTAAKGVGKMAAATAASGIESQIPGAGLPLSVATELLGIRGGIHDLVEAARRYKGDVYANRLAQTLSKKAEMMPAENPAFVPSSKVEEAPIDVVPYSANKQIGDQSGVHGIPAEEPIQVPKTKQIPTTLGEFQRLTAAPNQLLLPAPTEPATVASQTAPGQGGAPIVGGADTRLPEHYARFSPTTERGTSALIGQQPTAAGEQTVTGTPKTETAADLAFEYGEKNKMPVKHEQMMPDEAHSKKIAEFYDKAESNPKDPAVRKAYRAFNKETHDQYEYLVKKGFKFTPTEDSNTYPDSETMAKDVNENKHLKVWNGGAPEHGLMTAQQNFEFRAVHDVFGHTAPEATFGHQGEETAYFAHKSMYSAEAQKAMATETRGQNASVHFGDVGNDPSTIYENSLAGNGGKLKFPEQKAIILPKELREASRPQNVGKPKAEPEAKMPFKDWMKRMTPSQLKHVRAALDLVEDESKYSELQKAIDEATEK